MAAACNGIALYGGLRPYCATFMVFADYLKPALRLSALMKLPVIYVLTHDSIGRWRGRPHPSAHRAPSRPAGHPGHPGFPPPRTPRKTAACYIAALRPRACPAVMALTRQNLPQYAETSRDVERGAYILRDTAAGLPDVILMASGSEVQCIMEAADALEKEDISVRVVSVPCMDLFEQQDAAYQESVLPRAVTARVAVEAASSFGWHKYTGLDGKVIAIDHFGASAPCRHPVPGIRHQHPGRHRRGSVFGEYKGLTADEKKPLTAAFFRGMPGASRGAGGGGGGGGGVFCRGPQAPAKTNARPGGLRPPLSLSRNPAMRQAYAGFGSCSGQRRRI